jgi:chemotaxis protein methyltransferase CheR
VPALPLSPPVLAILSALIEEESGLHYDASDADLLAEKLSVRALERGFDSLLDYYYFLRYDDERDAELELLIELLVVHETYFFRELVPLVALIDHYLAPAVARGQRVRVWCAAAATGEEPFTLAMLLAARGLLGRVEIVASDISARALAQARRGQYSRRSLRNLVPGHERWLIVDGERARVSHEILAAVRFHRVNLVDHASAAKLGGRFDAILCRNVFIYFSLETAQRVVEQLSPALAPGGALLVGISESLLRFGTLLRCEEHGGAFFYERANP